jgi:uncharacterized membrane protein
MNWLLIIAALLHTGFMLGELFPWPNPLLLQIAIKKLPPGTSFTSEQQSMVATIVHNTGIYNSILAGGLFWAAFIGDPAADVARVLLIGAAVAGIFGTATLKSPITAVQALIGIVGFFLIKA